MSTHDSLVISDLAVTYSTSRGVVQAVQNVSLSVAPGQITAVVGESGSGKSTTAQAAIGLLADNAQITAGTMHLGEIDLARLTDKQWQRIRGPRIGLIPQDPNNSLNPVKTIGASVSEGLEIHTSLSTEARKARVIELLEMVGIDNPERRYRQYPHELSGGMKQRVLIAAALALEPDFIIADEPTSALDVTVQKTILDLIDELRRSRNIGVLLITHDLAVAGDRADRIVVMHDGQVKETGYAASVLSDPQDSYTRQLLADAPSLSVASVPQRRSVAGSVRAQQSAHAVAPWQRDVSAQAEPAPLLSVRNFTQKFGDFTAAENISFDVQRGTTHAIVGESGSGKTTTGRAIAGFSSPTTGEILFEGKRIDPKSKQLRKHVQLVYQNPYSSLNPKMTVGVTLAEPLKNFKLVGKSQIKERVARYLELVSLDPEFASRRPAELSGGQRQRVAIARALIVEPELVVFDEAVSALDVTVQSQILRLLARLQKELTLTYVFISHDLAVVRQISDTVSVMSAGQQVEYGETERVFSSPTSTFTRSLIDAIPGQRFRDGSLNMGL